MVGQPQGTGLQIAESAAQVIGGNASKLAAMCLDQPTPVERPSRIAVDEQERGGIGRVARRFVEVVVVAAPKITRQIERMRVERVERRPGGAVNQF